MNIASNLIVKAILNTTLISRLGTLEPKRHRHVVDSSKRCDESCLLLVFNYHLNVMIARISIQKTQMLTTRRSVNYLINTGREKGSAGQALFKSV